MAKAKPSKKTKVAKAKPAKAKTSKTKPAKAKVAKAKPAKPAMTRHAAATAATTPAMTKAAATKVVANAASTGAAPVATEVAKPKAKLLDSTKSPTGLLRGVALIDVALAKRKRKGALTPMSPEELAAIDLGGKPLSPSLARWLSVDREMFHLGRAQTVAELVASELPDFASSFGELAKQLPGPCVLFEGWGSDSRRFLYLGVIDDHGEYPVFTIDIDDMAYACINGPVDVWLAQQAGALAAENEYGQVPPAYEPARMALAKKCFGGNRAYLDGALSRDLDPWA